MWKKFGDDLFLAKIIAIVRLIVTGFIYFNSIDFYSFCWFSLVCWFFLSLQTGIGFILIEMKPVFERRLAMQTKQSIRNWSILFFLLYLSTSKLILNNKMWLLGNCYDSLSKLKWWGNVKGIIVLAKNSKQLLNETVFWWKGLQGEK